MVYCDRCGEPLITKSIHHKDRCRTNNHPDNIEMLCRVCHGYEHAFEGSGLAHNILDYMSLTQMIDDRWIGRRLEYGYALLNGEV